MKFQLKEVIERVKPEPRQHQPTRGLKKLGGNTRFELQSVGADGGTRWQCCAVAAAVILGWSMWEWGNGERSGANDAALGGGRMVMLVKVTVWQLLRFDARIYSAAVVVVAAVAGICGFRCVKGGAWDACRHRW